MMTKIVISTIADLIQTYCMYLILQCFFEQCRVSKKIETLCYGGLFLLLFLPHITLNIAWVNAVCSIGGVLLITNIYEGSFAKRLLNGIYSYMSLALVEVIVAGAFGYLHLDFMEQETYFSSFGMVVLSLAEYIVVRLLRNFKNLHDDRKLSAGSWCMFVGIPVLSMILYVLFYKQPHWQQGELILFVVVLFVINVLVLFLYNQQIRQLKIQQENQMLELQNEFQSHQLELMSDSVGAIRKMRHDFIRHISMIHYFNTEKRADELEKYLENLQSDLGEIGKYVDTGNYVLDSILNYKIHEASQYGINFTHEINVTGEQQFSAYDMNILLGNLIDNAIEAVKCLERKKIDLNMNLVHGKLYIEIRNPYENVIRDGERFCSTKTDKENHGYGVSIIQNIVDRYQGMLSIDTKQGIFCVSACLLLDD